MAECKLNAHEFIKHAFAPQIAVKCSPNAEKCCYKNNLNFTELLQPFARLNNDGKCSKIPIFNLVTLLFFSIFQRSDRTECNCS